ncbi:hypothetical protein [Streptomyces sp. PanSC19]|uniref:hypothetical protein n=1 Tax=Streptomyces sp. PanSC19 TaxID=1520455 RepID=UPI00160808E7|nr:hypothetical protein [Streptomyces sp. PanSC19]
MISESRPRAEGNFPVPASDDELRVLRRFDQSVRGGARHRRGRRVHARVPLPPRFQQVVQLSKEVAARLIADPGAMTAA